MSEPLSPVTPDPELVAVDAALVRLLERRAILTAERGFVPAAEAEELRRIFADRLTATGTLIAEGGALRPGALAQVWRALVMGALAKDGNFSVAICAGSDPLNALDLARSYFGGLVPIAMSGAAVSVVKAVADGIATVGLMSDPASGDEGNAWWTHLVNPAPGAPRVFAQLPFVQDVADVAPLYALSTRPLRPSGDDTTLVVAIGQGDTSRTRLQEAVIRAGLSASVVAATRPDNDSHRIFALLALEGFVAAGDPRLQALEAGRFAPVERVELVGVYPNPLRAAPAVHSEPSGEENVA